MQLGLRFLFPIKKIVSKMIDFDKSKCLFLIGETKFYSIL
jgi:hypothetical protein